MDRLTLTKQLRNLLELKDKNSLDDTFAEIADILLNRFVIKKGESKSYRILEIEFYHNLAEKAGSEKTVTYGRTAVAGQWLFHSSGVDICFESNEESYGGILIRAIRALDDEKPVCGPYNVMDVLFDKFDALGMPKDFPLLEGCEGSGDKVLRTIRKPGKSWSDEEKNKEYRFYLPEECWKDYKSVKYPASPFKTTTK